MAVSEYKQMCVFVGEKVYDNVFDGFDAFIKGKGSNPMYMTFILKRRQSVDTWVNQMRKAISGNWVRFLKAVQLWDTDIVGSASFIEKYGVQEEVATTDEQRDAYNDMYGVINGNKIEYITVKVFSM